MAAQVALRRSISLRLVKYKIYLLSFENRQQLIMNTNKTMPIMNHRKYKNSAMFFQQKRLTIQRNLQQLQRNSTTRDVIKSKRFYLLYDSHRLFLFHFFGNEDLQAQKYRTKSSANNIIFQLAIPIVNDRLRKRRCFADKELDNLPVLSSLIETTMTNSAFHLTGSSRSYSNNYHPDKSGQTKAGQKKCTDFFGSFYHWSGLINFISIYPRQMRRFLFGQ